MESVYLIQSEDFQSQDHVTHSSKGLVLETQALRGEAISQPIDVKAFNTCVVSWKSRTDLISSLEIAISVCVDETWSDWLSYGIWQKEGQTKGGLKTQVDERVKLMVDLLKVNEPQVAKAFKVKVVLMREELSVASPVLEKVYVSVACQATLEEDLQEVNQFDLESLKIEAKSKDVPAYSQMVIPEIGRVICSPTSVTMLMNYYGLNKPIEETASGAKDYQNGIYGNWAFNMAYAGECGFDAYVEVAHSKVNLIQMIESGLPFAMSIKTSQAEAIKGAPQAYPSGHLIVVTGILKTEEGLMVKVNDPASPEETHVTRHYPIKDLMRAWSRIVYRVKPVEVMA